MKARITTLACACALLAVPAAALASGSGSGGSASGLRAVVARLVGAELAGDGATTCGILYAPLTDTIAGRTCAQRWDARLERALAQRGGVAHLRADLRAATSAPIAMQGDYATIELPHPLLDGQSRFYWTANCWMLTR